MNAREQREHARLLAEVEHWKRLALQATSEGGSRCYVLSYEGTPPGRVERGLPDHSVIGWRINPQDEIHVSFRPGAFGPDGDGLYVNRTGQGLVVLPEASNALHLSFRKSR